MDTACVLTIAGGTAKLLLNAAARLERGESILIPAATGGVGSFAVQIARQTEAGKIIALVGSAAKKDRALSLGAHDAVDASDPMWPANVRALTGGKGVDVALEASGGTVLEQTLACLASFGRLIVFGAASGRSGELSRAALDQLLYAPAANQSLSGFNIGSWFQERPAVAGKALVELTTDVMTGRIRPPSIRTLPLAKAQEAHEQMEQRSVSGKLVIKPWA